MFDIEKVWQAVLAVLFAVIGGLAHLMHKKDGKLSWGRIATEIFVSGFIGLLTLMLARASGLSGDWLGFVCGMAGWIGPRMIDLFMKPFGKATGIDVNENKDKETKDEK